MASEDARVAARLRARGAFVTAEGLGALLARSGGGGDAWQAVIDADLREVGAAVLPREGDAVRDVAEVRAVPRPALLCRGE